MAGGKSRRSIRAANSKTGPGTEATEKLRTEYKTDPTRWRLKDNDGRHTWHYITDDGEMREWPQSMAEKWYMKLSLELPNLPKPTAAIDAAKNGLEFFEKLQLPSGHWACEYGGPLFLLPSIVIAWYVTKTPIPEAYAVEMKRYLTERANATDGGWGLYVGDESTTFGTTLNYVLLRLIGVESDDPVMVRARGSLYKLGGALYAPDWAKFWLATLGVVSWDLVNPIPPEAWLLPDWVPFAPWRWWVHTRQVFLPMSYIYSRKWQYPEDDVIRGLKVELFTEDLTTINWESYRNSIDPRDNSYPRSWLLNTMNWAIVNLYNPVRPNFLKDKGEAWVSELIDMEDANTDYVDLGPVNASVNTIVCYIRDGPEASSTMRHLQKLQEFLWVNNEGLLANGTNGLQCWDTAFLLRAVYKAGLHRDKQWRPTMLRALDFLERQQIRENCIDQEKCYRQPRKGGWPFSNREQGYPVSDCIAEAMSSIILFQKTDGYPTLVEDGRIYDAVDLLLQYQNSSGGLGSYEATRGGKYMELLNGSTVFGRIMIEYDYPECTGACITALSLFNTHWPNYRSKEIKLFLNRAIKWIHSNQLPDGSWYGSWGICFTYATMFALESLASMGEMYDNSDVSKRGCQFLLSKQREDGGWSESYKGCETMVYTEDPIGSQVVQTAWALIGLMEAEYSDVERLKKGIKLIIDRQQPNGEWLQESIEGVFNKFCMISYPNYKFTFTIRALGMFAKKFPYERF